MVSGFDGVGKTAHGGPCDEARVTSVWPTNFESINGCWDEGLPWLRLSGKTFHQGFQCVHLLLGGSCRANFDGSISGARLMPREPSCRITAVAKLVYDGVLVQAVPDIYGVVTTHTVYFKTFNLIDVLVARAVG
jgi:hypothetical protein